MPRSCKPKVYGTAAGFNDAILAAPSQKAALAAGGTTTDLFAAKRAWIVDDPDISAEALGKAGEVIMRPRIDPDDDLN